MFFVSVCRLGILDLAVELRVCPSGRATQLSSALEKFWRYAYHFSFGIVKRLVLPIRLRWIDNTFGLACDAKNSATGRLCPAIAEFSWCV